MLLFNVSFNAFNIASIWSSFQPVPGGTLFIPRNSQDITFLAELFTVRSAHEVFIGLDDSNAETLSDAYQDQVWSDGTGKLLILI